MFRFENRHTVVAALLRSLQQPIKFGTHVFRVHSNSRQTSQAVLTSLVNKQETNTSMHSTIHRSRDSSTRPTNSVCGHKLSYENPKHCISKRAPRYTRLVQPSCITKVNACILQCTAVSSSDCTSQDGYYHHFIVSEALPRIFAPCVCIIHTVLVHRLDLCVSPNNYTLIASHRSECLISSSEKLVRPREDTLRGMPSVLRSQQSLLFKSRLLQTVLCWRRDRNLLLSSVQNPTIII